jgi:hypothetical protein
LSKRLRFSKPATIAGPIRRAIKVNPVLIFFSVFYGSVAAGIG